MTKDKISTFVIWAGIWLTSEIWPFVEQFFFAHSTLDMFHVCYEVTSVNTAELRSVMHNSNWQNTENLVDCGLVVEQSVAEAAEQSGIKK